MPPGQARQKSHAREIASLTTGGQVGDFEQLTNPHDDTDVRFSTSFLPIDVEVFGNIAAVKPHQDWIKKNLLGPGNDGLSKEGGKSKDKLPIVKYRFEKLPAAAGKEKLQQLNESKQDPQLRNAHPDGIQTYDDLLTAQEVYRLSTTAVGQQTQMVLIFSDADGGERLVLIAPFFTRGVGWTHVDVCGEFRLGPWQALQAADGNDESDSDDEEDEAKVDVVGAEDFDDHFLKTDVSFPSELLQYVADNNGRPSAAGICRDVLEKRFIEVVPEEKNGNQKLAMPGVDAPLLRGAAGLGTPYTTGGKQALRLMGNNEKLDLIAQVFNSCVTREICDPAAKQYGDGVNAGAGGAGANVAGVGAIGPAAGFFGAGAMGAGAAGANVGGALAPGAGGLKCDYSLFTDKTCVIVPSAATVLAQNAARTGTPEDAAYQLGNAFFSAKLAINVLGAEGCADAMACHTDSNDRDGLTLMFVGMSAGATGGRSFHEEADGPDQHPDKNGVMKKGRFYDCSGKWLVFSEKNGHGVEQVKDGIRISIAAYLPGYNAELMTHSLHAKLMAHNFRLPPMPEDEQLPNGKRRLPCVYNFGDGKRQKVLPVPEYLPGQTLAEVVCGITAENDEDAPLRAVLGKTKLRPDVLCEKVAQAKRGSLTLEPTSVGA